MFLVVVFAYNVVDMSTFHCLFFDGMFVKIYEALVSFALLFMAIN